MTTDPRDRAVVHQLRPPALEAPPPDSDEPHDAHAHDAYAPPQDRAAERAVLGAILTSRTAIEQVSTMLTGPDFYTPAHEAIWDAAVHLYARLQPVDVLTVADILDKREQLRRIGGVAFLHELVADVITSANADYHAQIVAERATLRRLAEAGTRIATLGHRPTGDLHDILHAAHDALEQITRTVPGVEPDGPGQDIDAFLAADDDIEPEWIIPGFLERRDRLIVTAAEGGGKSTLLRQWAVQAAYGEHPFTGVGHAPLKVVLLDLENSDRQIRRALRPLRIQARDIDPGNLVIVCKSDGLELNKPTDRAWLDRLLTIHKPDLLVTGPLYKLAGGNPNDEVDSKPAALAIDALRVRHDVAVILEAHTRKGEDAGNPRKRPKEPFGWSGWMRWPEFGIHLSKDGDVTHWRGMRDNTREFPEMLLRGGRWPWMPAQSPDEARFHQIRQCVQEAGEELTTREISKRTGIPETSVRRYIASHGQQWAAIITRLQIEAQDLAGGAP